MTMFDHEKAAQKPLPRSFWAFLVSETLGVFNDNFFKMALVTFVLYRGLHVFGWDENEMQIYSAALFILPFLLFSATAGQLADKYRKNYLIRGIKLWELAIGFLSVFAVFTNRPDLLVVILFLLGTQSAFFGPVKYGVVPELVDEDQLVTANAYVETSTKVAILAGSIIGNGVATLEGAGLWVALTVVVIALVGYLAARMIPALPPANPDLTIDWSFFTATYQILRSIFREQKLFLICLGVSWFWFISAGLMVLLQTYGKVSLHLDAMAPSYFLGLSAVGVGLGSFWFQRLSKGFLELGTIAFGLIGMGFSLAGLAALGDPYSQPVTGDSSSLTSVLDFIQTPVGISVSLLLIGYATFSGWMIVPLFTLLQKTPDKAMRSQVISGNNIINAGFMVGSSFFLKLVESYTSTATDYVTYSFGLLSLFCFLGGIFSWSYLFIPTMRFLLAMGAQAMGGYRTVGENQVPDTGAAMVVSNHVSFIDWLYLASAFKRPLRFVMWIGFFDLPFLNKIFKWGRVVPIASNKEDPERLKFAFERIRCEIEEEQILGVFPEGEITHNGEMVHFRRGIERMVEATDKDVFIQPLVLKGLWASPFSRNPRSLWSRVWSWLILRRQDVIVEFLEPVLYSGGTKAEGLAERCEKIVKEAWSKTEEKNR